VALDGLMETDRELIEVTDTKPSVVAIGTPVPSGAAATAPESWAARLPVAAGARVSVITAATPLGITFWLTPVIRQVARAHVIDFPAAAAAGPMTALVETI
jgi:hypothetical protein